MGIGGHLRYALGPGPSRRFPKLSRPREVLALIYLLCILCNFTRINLAIALNQARARIPDCPRVKHLEIHQDLKHARVHREVPRSTVQNTTP